MSAPEFACRLRWLWAVALALALMLSTHCRLWAQELLPTIESAPPQGSSGRLLGILISGDGNWSGADQRLADSLSAHGIPSVGLAARSYLRASPRTPESVARDLAALAERYLAAWRRDQIVFVGYSRGASLGPFALARWPEDLRDRVKLVVLIGPGERVGFRFHWLDLVRDKQRAGDLPVLPEIERLRGIPILCVFGTAERASICRNPPTALWEPFERPGGHRLGDSPVAAARIVAELVELGLVGGARP